MGFLGNLFKKKGSSMSDVIENVLKNPQDEYKDIINDIKRLFSITGLNELKDTLLLIERSALSSSDPIKYIRNEIMDAVYDSTFNAKILECSDDQIAVITSQIFKNTKKDIFAVLLHTEFMVICLRLYSHVNYSDAGSKDWFQLWKRGARLKASAEISAFLIKVGKAEGNLMLSAAILKGFYDTEPELRRNLLASPVGAVFPETDIE
jgi:hypothetical protein